MSAINPSPNYQVALSFIKALDEKRLSDLESCLSDDFIYRYTPVLYSTLSPGATLRSDRLLLGRIRNASSR
jgi:hypothetical protein